VSEVVVVATGPAAHTPKIDDTDPELAMDPLMTTAFGPEMRRVDRCVGDQERVMIVGMVSSL
jgi:hypothetical protein